jgi:hypothetical protein
MLASTALVIILLGLVTVGQGLVYRWRRSRGRKPLLPGWVPGGWWPHHPTATLRVGWVVVTVGVLLLLVAIYERLRG